MVLASFDNAADSADEAASSSKAVTPKLKGKHAIIGGVLCLAKRKEKKMSIDYHILVYRMTKEEKLYLF